MDLNRPGRLYPDGVFVFNEPVKVKVESNKKETYAHGYTTNCSCGKCVFVEPWPYADDYGFAIRSWALEEVKQ